MQNPKYPKTIYLIRHGLTGGNERGEWLGAKSVHELNEYGGKQARDTADTLKKINVDASKIYSSPTERALQHAEILQRHLQLSIEKINSITEINLGILEDRSRKEGLKLVPEEVAKWENNLREFSPPLGESAVEAAERFYETVELIACNAQKQDLVFVSHGVVIKLFLARILCASIETGEAKIDVPWTRHGSITVVTCNEQGFKFKKVIENKYPDSDEVAALG
ncbi:MAG: histidine phosphatase family protein [Patescibacteria group bacterium]|nr:histidine phosphatase family protein [Patescibacteria group bacterium]